MKKVAAAAGAAVIAASVGTVAYWEGKENTVYRDLVGLPTVCYGHMDRKLVVGQRFNDAQCKRLLEADLSEAYSHVQRCIRHDLPVPTLAAFTSLTFNVGPKGVCGSTLQKHANNRDIAQACMQLTKWVYAGGRRVQGLVNRRASEYKLCMQGYGQ